MVSTPRRRILIEAAKLFDLAVMIFSFGLATLLVAHETPTSSFAQFFAMRVKLQNFFLFGCFLFGCYAIFSAFGLYNSKRLSTRAAVLLGTLEATSVASLTLLVAALLLRIQMVTPRFIMFFYAASTTIAVSCRLLARYVLQRVRSRGRNIRNVLVVGTNSRAVRFTQRVQAHRELGYRLIGFVDDHWQGSGEFQKNGHKLVADLEGFQPFLRDHVVDEVVIALPMLSLYAQGARIAALCEEQGIMVRLLSDLFNSRLAHSTAGEFEGEAITTLATGRPDGWQGILKRALDVSLSLLAMLLLSPLFLLAALVVKLTSPGPAFFVQERVGLNKHRFPLYKFRTMVADAPQRQWQIEHLNEALGPVFKIRNDPRITRVGTFLRKTSIDELPQLFNVLKGDMSLVGPRPLPERDYNGFHQDWQRRRFSVRPGITCLWQINGRSTCAFEKWMQLDMQYIDQWSLGLDFKILAKTIPAVLKGAGAA
jgi:exopolysaccharide biosynthesis polyprenyl glycosylphosphotransferase